MLDDLRNSENFFIEEPEPAPVEKPRRKRPARGPFLGLTPQQRFTLALMFFLMVTVLGVLLLVIMEKVYITLF